MDCGSGDHNARGAAAAAAAADEHAAASCVVPRNRQKMKHIDCGADELLVQLHREGRKVRAFPNWSVVMFISKVAPQPPFHPHHTPLVRGMGGSDKA